MEKPDEKEIIRSFIRSRQWAKENIKKPETERINKKLNEMTQRMSIGMQTNEDMINAELYITRIEKYKNILEKAVGSIDAFKAMETDSAVLN